MNKTTTQRWLLAMVCAGLLATACNEPPAVNPWRDDSITNDTWSNPSRDGVIASGAQPVLRQREVPQETVTENPGVPHYPLWWEDPFEDKGDGNDTFAWTWVDYLDMPYGLGRYILNTIAWPVSAIVTLPGTPMVSDSYIGKDHDAARGKSPDPVATSVDFTPNAAEEAAMAENTAE